MLGFTTKSITRILLLLVLLSFVGCPGKPEQEIRVGTNVWPGYEPLYLASELGFFKGANIRLVEYPSATEVIRGFKNKNLEAAALTLDEAIYLRQYDENVVIVLVLDVSNGGDVIIAQPEINDFSELKGKRIAVEANALGAYFVSRALELHNMTLGDINIVHTEVSNHEELFVTKQVDAAVTFEPVRTKLLASGGKEVFSSKEIPGEITDVLVVRKQVLKDMKRRLTKLVDGWFLALDELKERPQKSATLLAPRLKISPEEVLASYDGLILPKRTENHAFLTQVNGMLGYNIQQLSKVMQEKGLLRSEFQSPKFYSDILLGE